MEMVSLVMLIMVSIVRMNLDDDYEDEDREKTT